MEIWLVVAEGVYDHGVWYATGERSDAERFIRDWLPDGDNWHRWRIEQVRLGQEPEEEPDEEQGGGRWHGVRPRRRRRFSPLAR